MRTKSMLLASFLFVGGVVSSAFAESYTDGIEYFKSGQPDRAKIILDKTLNDPSTKKAEAYFYLGEIYSGMNKLDSAGMYYDMGLQADPLYPYNSIGKGKLMLKNNKKEAEALFKAVIKSDKKNPEIYLAISKAYYENVMPEYQKYLDKALDADKEYAVAEEYRKKLKTKCPSVEQNVGNLSGGNQQKVLLAKWMFAEPDILILDEPTRGIDVGAKYDIYCLINQMVEQGKSVIMISSEMPEILGMRDRIYIMNEGKMAGELDAKEATQEGIMAHIMQNQKK